MSCRALAAGLPVSISSPLAKLFYLAVEGVVNKIRLGTERVPNIHMYICMYNVYTYIHVYMYLYVCTYMYRLQYIHSVCTIQYISMYLPTDYTTL